MGKKEEDKDKKDEDNDSTMKNEENKKESESESTSASTEKDKKDKEEEDQKDKEKEKEKMEVDDEDDDDKKKKKKDKKKITRNLMITGNFFNELKASEYNKMFELESNFANVDRIVRETDEAKNDLETYVYDLRDKLENEEHSAFCEPKAVESTKS